MQLGKSESGLVEDFLRGEIDPEDKSTIFSVTDIEQNSEVDEITENG